MTPLQTLKKQLEELAKRSPALPRYTVPGLWKPVGAAFPQDPSPVQVHPAVFFLDHLKAIETHALPDIDPRRSLNSQLPEGNGGDWIARESIYNLFVRLTTAYDHDGDGTLGGAADPTLNGAGIRESGTFLKSIALLGHIKRLGATTIHLLPVTTIGRDGNKGNLGSPYAIRDPYAIEPSQADPLVSLSVEEQFKAFIEACHLLGIRVICEFVFRTASKDSDWIASNPEWFYWIDAKVNDRQPGETDLEKAKKGYGNPIFDAETLAVIKAKVDRNDFQELPPPPEAYRRFFKLPPKPAEVKLNAQGQFRAVSPDPWTGGKTETRIPGAFADWPPDDNQPPWGDVTYLKMYLDEDPQKPQFNYIGYNTIRMYDADLAQDRLANRPLWNKIRDLIPAYQITYGIDGVMVDMGHAVPVDLMRDIVETARKHDPHFAFLSENFAIEESSVRAGYNAVVGYAWWVEYHRQGLYDLLDHVGKRGVPLSWFGAVENHNTPRAAGRAGGERYARYAFLVNSMLPRSVPFIHSGFELGETHPVNTGLDFKNEDLEKLKGKALPLFDLTCLNWASDSKMLAFTQQVLRIRDQFKSTILGYSPESFVRPESGHEDLIVFLRKGHGKTILVLVNRDLEAAHDSDINLEGHVSGDVSLTDLLPLPGKPASLQVKNRRLRVSVPAGECFLCAW